jgi:hypothetical protein
LSELVSVKDLSNVENALSVGYTSDSLSLKSSCRVQLKNSNDLNSFYLNDVDHSISNEKLRSLQPIKLRRNSCETKQWNTLPMELSRRRSIIRHLTSLSNSFHQHSVHSLFSKDSLQQ